MFEKRKQLMFSLLGGEPTHREAYFLKPTSVSGKKMASPAIFSTQHLLDINFYSFPVPHPEWPQWVEKMSCTYGTVWKEAGIDKAIMGSIYEIPINDEVIYGLAERWCYQTSTFFFPWGESTITFEDMAVLGGFSVLGEPFTLPLESQELVEIQQELEKARQELGKSNDVNQPHHLNWLKHFMGKGSRVEHEAFLAMWLSWYVFSGHHADIKKHVFPIAIHLAKGTRIALAPPVLASIYRDLANLRVSININTIEQKIDDFNLSAPFVLVQIWAWERIPQLQPKPRFLEHGKPRLARWHGLELGDTATANSRLVLASTTTKFLWRPYTISVDEWAPPEFYKEEGGWFDSTDLNENKELASFVYFLRDCVMVGFNYREYYLPSRVALQFGLDQDVPGLILPSERTIESPWIMYSQLFKDTKIYVPPRMFQSGVTLDYTEWWELGPKEAIKPFPREERTPRKRKSMQGSIPVTGSKDDSMDHGAVISTQVTEYSGRTEQHAEPVVLDLQGQGDTGKPK